MDIGRQFITLIRERSGMQETFFGRRFRIDKFSGLPLTVLIVLFVFNLSFLADFIEDVVNSKEFITIDASIANFLYFIRNPQFSIALYYITKICSIEGVLIGAIVCLVYSFLRKDFNFAVAMGISTTGSELSIYL